MQFNMLKERVGFKPSPFCSSVWSNCPSLPVRPTASYFAVRCRGAHAACTNVLCAFAVIALLPAFIGLIGHLTIEACGIVMRYFGREPSALALQSVIVLFWVVFGGTWFLLVGTARLSSQPFHHTLWLVRVVINMLIILTNGVLMVALFILGMTDFTIILAVMGHKPLLYFQLGFCAGVLYICSPFVLTMMHSWKSFSSLFKKCLVYYGKNAAE